MQEILEDISPALKWHVDIVFGPLVANIIENLFQMVQDMCIVLKGKHETTNFYLG